MSDRKFYETIFSFKVLSEQPVDHYSLRSIAHEIMEGYCVGSEVNTEVKELTAKEAAKGLTELGSEPLFFNLDLNGNEIFDPCLICDSVDCTCDEPDSHQHCNTNNCPCDDQEDAQKEIAEYTVTAIYDILACMDEEIQICSTNSQSEAIDVYNETIRDHYYYQVYLRSKSDPDFNKTHTE